MAEKRRGSLIGSMKAAADQVAAGPSGPSSANRASEEMLTTAVHIPKEVLSLLRRVAVERANRQGGRPSVSAVLTDLVRDHWVALQAEAERR